MKKPKFINPIILCDSSIPLPLSGLNPRTILGRDWWKKARKKAIELNNGCCWSCGIDFEFAVISKTPQAHERYNYYELKNLAIGEMFEVCALCYCCHNYIHKKRLESLVKKGIIRRQTALIILAKGNEIITKNNLKPLYLSAKLLNRPWEDWRLLLNGKFHTPLYKSSSELTAKYS